MPERGAVDEVAEILGCRDEDDLRLLGLSRIPLCSTCPVLAWLRDRHEEHAACEPEPPAVPAACVRQICAPMVARATNTPRSPRRRASGDQR